MKRLRQVGSVAKKGAVVSTSVAKEPGLQILPVTFILVNTSSDEGWIGEWVDPRVALDSDDEEEILELLQGSNPDIQSVCQHSSDLQRLVWWKGIPRVK
jgi:hypothetical protein